MKLLIVDDMPSTHVIIENLINERNLKFDAILHSYNGAECLQTIADEEPDIVLLDMEMPIASGTDVMEALSPETGPLIIVLSAYDKFSYVRQALHSCAFDYLLKPIDIDELIDVLERAIRRCYDNIVDSIRYCLTVADRADIPEGLFRMAHFSFYLSSWMVIGADSAEMPKIDRAMRIATIVLGSKEYIMLHDAAECSPNRLREEIAAHPDLRERYRICISDRILHNAAELMDCITQFRSDASALAFYYRDAVADNSWMSEFPYSDHIAQEFFEEMTLENLGTYVDRIFDEIAAAYGHEANYNAILFNSINNLLKHVFSEYSPEIGDASSFHADTVQELKKFLARIFQNALSQRTEEESSFSASNADIEAAKKYIDEHYMDSFTLGELSSAVFMSKFNLCRKFKQRYHVGIWNYVKQARLARACVLLRSTDMKVYKIAEEVGFNDASYFSNVFRSTHGMSPQAYRNQSGLDAGKGDSLN